CNRVLNFEDLRDVEIVLSGVIERGEAVRAYPDGRSRPLVRMWLRKCLLDRPRLAAEGDLALGPGPYHDRKYLPAGGVARLEADLLRLEFAQPRAVAEGGLEAALRKMVDHREVLREPHRMVQRQLEDHCADTDRLRCSRQRREIDGRCRDAIETCVLVLDE